MPCLYHLPYPVNTLHFTWVIYKRHPHDFNSNFHRNKANLNEVIPTSTLINLAARYGSCVNTSLDATQHLPILYKRIII